VDLTIRPGRPQDLEDIKTFTTGTFEWGDYVADEYLNWLANDSVQAIVATGPGGRVVAVAKVAMLSPVEGWLAAARVHPEYRRQGIGSRINEAGGDWLRERGAQVVRLAIEEVNDPARRQVEKLGYRPVARFALAVRGFERMGHGANGGKRLPAPERFDLAHSSESVPAYMLWSTSEYSRAGHGLYPVEGWSFRRLYAADLEEAARQRRLWACPSGWAVVEAGHDGLWLPLFITSAEDSGRAARALTDLADEQRVGRLQAMVPRIPWLEEALTAEHFEVKHPNFIYEKPL
jgi:ribosomal protein S18 acetylase RimI-like enzyme